MMSIHKPGRCSGARLGVAARGTFTLLALSAAWNAACAQQAAPGAVSGTGAGTGTPGRFSIVPNAALSETLSDNVNLSATGKQADAATQASVGIHVGSNGGRVRGSFDYSLIGITHTASRSQNEFQNALNGQGTAELLTNRVFVDMTGNISQRSVSAFGPQSTDNTSTNANRTEVRTFGVSPYLRGQFGAVADYELRYQGRWTRSKGGSASDIDSNTALAHLNSSRPGPFSWSGDLSRTQATYSLGRTSEQDRLSVALNYNVTPDLMASLIGGRESNDYASVQKQSYNNEGVQLRWIPSTRTNLSALFERRFFGNAHSVNFSYRTVRTAWTFTDTKDVQIGQDQQGAVTLGSFHDVLSSALIAQFPDPLLREAVVQEALRRSGLDPNAPYSYGFLTSQALLQRNQALSFAILGVRETIVFRMLRTTTNGLNKLILASRDDLSTTNNVVQSTYGVDYSYRLNAMSSASAYASWQRTAASNSVSTGVLRLYSASYNANLGRLASGSVGFRRSNQSGTYTYAENAVWANFIQRF